MSRLTSLPVVAVMRRVNMWAASGAEHQEARNDDSQNQMSVTLVHRLPRAPPDPLDLTIRSTLRPISLVRILVAIDEVVMARRAQPCREVV